MKKLKLEKSQKILFAFWAAFFVAVGLESGVFYRRMTYHLELSSAQSKSLTIQTDFLSTRYIGGECLEVSYDYKGELDLEVIVMNTETDTLVYKMNRDKYPFKEGFKPVDVYYKPNEYIYIPPKVKEVRVISTSKATNSEVRITIHRTNRCD